MYNNASLNNVLKKNMQEPFESKALSAPETPEEKEALKNYVTVSDELRAKYFDRIFDLEHGRYTHFEKLENHELFSLAVTYADRLLLVRPDPNMKNHYAVIEEILNHAYGDSKYLNNPEVLRAYMENKLLPQLRQIASAHFLPVNPQDPQFNLPASCSPFGKSIHITIDHLCFDGGRFFFLSDLQIQAIASAEPLLIPGPVGSGKSLIGIMILLNKAKHAHKDNKLRLLYVAKSKELVKEKKIDFWRHPIAKELIANGTTKHFKIEFKTIRQLLGSNNASAKKAFDAWLPKYKHHLVQREKHRIEKIAFLFQDTDKIYTEFRNIAGNSKEEYLAFGENQSLFQDPTHRRAMFDAFEDYLSNYQSLDLITDKDAKAVYDGMVADEIQDNTKAIVKWLIALVKYYQIVLLNGQSQRLSDPLSNQQYFVNLFPAHVKMNIIELSQSFRCPTVVLDFINHVFDIKHEILRKFSKPKQDPRLVSPAEKPGHLYRKDILKLSQPLVRRHNRLIITTEKNKAKAKKVFNTSLVLTIKEAKGLEFDEVVLYNFFDGENDHENIWELASQILEGNSKSIAEILNTENAGAYFFNIPFDELATAIGRTLKKFIIIQDPNPCIQTLMDALMGHIPFEPEASEEKASTPEEMFETVQKLRDKGKTEEAKDLVNELIKEAPNEEKKEEIRLAWRTTTQSKRKKNPKPPAAPKQKKDSSDDNFPESNEKKNTEKESLYTSKFAESEETVNAWIRSNVFIDIHLQTSDIREHFLDFLINSPIAAKFFKLSYLSEDIVIDHIQMPRLFYLIFFKDPKSILLGIQCFRMLLKTNNDVASLTKETFFKKNPNGYNVFLQFCAHDPAFLVEFAYLPLFENITINDLMLCNTDKSSPLSLLIKSEDGLKFLFEVLKKNAEIRPMFAKLLGIKVNGQTEPLSKILVKFKAGLDIVCFLVEQDHDLVKFLSDDVWRKLPNELRDKISATACSQLIHRLFAELETNDKDKQYYLFRGVFESDKFKEIFYGEYEDHIENHEDTAFHKIIIDPRKRDIFCDFISENPEFIPYVSLKFLCTFYDSPSVGNMFDLWYLIQNEKGKKLFEAFLQDQEQIKYLSSDNLYQIIMPNLKLNGSSHPSGISFACLLWGEAPYLLVLIYKNSRLLLNAIPMLLCTYSTNQEIRDWLHKLLNKLTLTELGIRILDDMFYRLPDAQLQEFIHACAKIPGFIPSLYAREDGKSLIFSLCARIAKYRYPEEKEEKNVLINPAILALVGETPTVLENLDPLIERIMQANAPEALESLLEELFRHKNFLDLMFSLPITFKNQTFISLFHFLLQIHGEVFAAFIIKNPTAASRFHQEILANTFYIGIYKIIPLLTLLKNGFGNKILCYLLDNGGVITAEAFFHSDHSFSSAFQYLIITHNTEMLLRILKTDDLIRKEAMRRIIAHERIPGVPFQENNTLFAAICQEESLDFLKDLWDEAFYSQLSLDHFCFLLQKDSPFLFSEIPVETWAFYALAKTEQGCILLDAFFYHLSKRENRPTYQLLQQRILQFCSDKKKNIFLLLKLDPTYGKRVLTLLDDWENSKKDKVLFAPRQAQNPLEPDLLYIYKAVFRPETPGGIYEKEFLVKNLQRSLYREVFIHFLKNNPHAANCFNARFLSDCAPDDDMRMPRLYYLIYTPLGIQSIIDGFTCFNALLKINQDALDLKLQAFLRRDSRGYSVFLLIAALDPNCFLALASLFVHMAVEELVKPCIDDTSHFFAQKTPIALLLKSSGGLGFLYRYFEANPFHHDLIHKPFWTERYGHNDCTFFQALVKSERGCDILYILLKNNPQALASITAKILQEPLPNKDGLTPLECIVEKHQHAGLCYLLETQIVEAYMQALRPKFGCKGLLTQAKEQAQTSQFSSNPMILFAQNKSLDEPTSRWLEGIIRCKRGFIE